MEKLRNKIMNILNEKHLASFATMTEDGKPWVRYTTLNCDENLVLRFSTFASSRKVKQIQNNPEVHITYGITDLRRDKYYLQIQGLAKVSNDPNEKDNYWNDNLKYFFKDKDDPEYRVVIIKPYRIELNGMGIKEPEVLSISVEEK